ncbi:hypothetical protein APHAL10511_005812 [Amanita phalloides]|nr:hypothetical protein APHAL10511_005812 [Amanita phalloides]
MGQHGQAIARRKARGITSGLTDLCWDYPDDSAHKLRVRVHAPLTGTSVCSRLPTELLSLVFSCVSSRDLASVARTNSAFYATAICVLYNDLKSLSARQWIRCFHSLTKNTSLPPLVRSLDIDWQLLKPTHNLYRLLHTVLRSLTSLRLLHLDFPKHHSPTWLLDGCTFLLRSFTTSLHCKASLARFLESQPGIVELTLRGFQNCTSSMNPFHILSADIDFQPLSTDFELKPGALPSLALFNAVHAGPPVIRTVAGGRPVRAVSVPLFRRCTTETLDALTLTSGTIRRMSLISFDPDAPAFLFAQLVERFPRLEALHVVLLMTECNLALLHSTAAHLAKFKSLQYITFMATMDTEEDVDERNVAKKWHAACPTLKTIILPRGKVWFDAGTHSGWSCLG